MATRIEELFAKYTNAQTEKERFRNLYSDIYRYGMPDRYPELQEYQDSQGNKHRYEIFDSTFEIACDDFVNKVQGLIAPVNADWVDIEVGYMFDNAAESGIVEANRRLGELAKILNVYKSLSNFDIAMTEGLYDLVAGTMVLMCIEGDERNPMVFSAIPFREITMVDGPDGTTWYYFRKFDKKNWEIVQQWKDAKHEYDADRPDDVVAITEATFYDPKMRTWNYWVITDKDKKAIVQREYRTAPFINLRWTKMSNETYGRGQGLKVIDDFKTLNRLKEYSLRALQFIVPFFLVDSSEDYENWLIRPGAILPVNANAKDNPPLVPVSVNQQADLQHWNMQALTMSVKRGMFSNTLSDIPDQTATAVQKEDAQQKRIIANSLGRLDVFLYAIVKRMIDVLQRQGLFPLDFDIEMLNGYGAKIRIDTELANLQAMDKMEKKMNAIALMNSFDATGATTARFVKTDVAVPKILKAIGMDAEEIRTDEELAQYDQQMAESNQAAQQAEIDKELIIARGKEEARAAATNKVQK